MSARYPLVNVSGTVKELPAGDCALTYSTPSSFQLLGTDGVTIAEVEAATKALRAAFVPDDTPAPSAGIVIGRYCVGVGGLTNNVGASATTETISNDVFTLAWLANPGIAVIKEVSCGYHTGALAGNRFGACRMDMFLYTSITALGGNVATAEGKTSFGQLGAHGNRGLLTRQPPSLAEVRYQAPLPVQTLVTATTDTNPMSTVSGSLRSVAGANGFTGKKLFSSKDAGQPIILTAGCGFTVKMTGPPSVTSQTVSFSMNVRWDEWVFAGQDGLR